ARAAGRGHLAAGAPVPAGPGRHGAAAAAPLSPPGGARMSLLQVRGLSKAFGGVKAVDGVDFSLEKGELLALIGPNGAGKSTTFNLVGGQLAPDSGSVQLAGREMAGLPPRAIWRLGVGRTFQIAATFA